MLIKIDKTGLYNVETVATPFGMQAKVTYFEDTPTNELDFVSYWYPKDPQNAKIYFKHD